MDARDREVAENVDEGTDQANDAVGAWNEEDSKIFVEFGRTMVPGREQIEQTFLDLIPAQPHEPFLAVWRSAPARDG